MLYFLIPVYNEEANLEAFYMSIKKALTDKNKFYVFVDDGSTDNSVAVLEKIATPGNYTILRDSPNHGPGYAFNIGFEWILGHSKNDSDRIITLESDNTSSLEILEKMLSVSNSGFDLVLASIYAQGGGIDKTSFIRKIISFCANLFFRFAFDIKVLTLSSFYRIYTVELIRNIKSRFNIIIEEKGFISMIEILIKSIRLKANIIEVPMILYSAKRKGKSKMKVLKTMFAYGRFLLTKKY